MFPNGNNPLHSDCVVATYSDGYLYCKGSDPMGGPDYYWGDVFVYNLGFMVIGE